MNFTQFSPTCQSTDAFKPDCSIFQFSGDRFKMESVRAANLLELCTLSPCPHLALYSPN
jgi:hypothetical protein